MVKSLSNLGLDIGLIGLPEKGHNTTLCQVENNDYRSWIKVELLPAAFHKLGEFQATVKELDLFIAKPKSDALG